MCFGQKCRDCCESIFVNALEFSPVGIANVIELQFVESQVCDLGGDL